MESSPTGIEPRSSVPAARRGVPESRAPRTTTAPLALIAALAFAGCLAFPRIHDHPGLVRCFAAVAVGLLAWHAILALVARRRGRPLVIELVRPVKSHYIQASCQACIYAYWGWYWPNVYGAVPLILGQLLFLYAFEALLTWSRGRAWRIGFGPWPIILSTNLFLWFKDDWFAYQFALVAACALSKEFLRWNRDGRSTHIFNPSAFGLSACSILLIATQTTHLTWGIEVASTLALPPYIYIVIFGLGLIVQYFFSVTLMTLSAVAALYVMNLAYTGATGVYHFIDTNIPIAVFLGMHFLVTDPATSPRSDVGRVIFGGLYGAANFALYTLLGDAGVPDFYDKLLPVPILNLCVPWIDRLSRSGPASWLGRVTSISPPSRANLVHIGCWGALFAIMVATGFVHGPHEGASLAFWEKAHAEGKTGASAKLVRMVGAMAHGGNADACNRLGSIHLDGKLVPEDPAAASHYFARACELGSARGCENVAWLLLSRGVARSEADAAAAFEHLERGLASDRDGRAAYLLGLAHEIARGRPLDPDRARELYRAACERGNLDAAKGLVRLAIADKAAPQDLELAVRGLAIAGERGDPQCRVHLAYLHHAGFAVPQDAARAEELLESVRERPWGRARPALGRPTRWDEVRAEIARPPVR